MATSLPITYKALPDLPEYAQVDVGSAFAPYSYTDGLNFNGNYSGGMNFEGGLSQYNSGLGLNSNGLSTTSGNPGLSNFTKGIAGLQTLGSLMGAWNGYQQTKVAKQQLAFQKDAFNKQYGAQRNLTNSQLEDRQRRRVSEAAANGYTGTMSVAEYMDKYGVK